MRRKILISLIILLAIGGMIALELILNNMNGQNPLEETGPIKAEKTVHIGKHIYYAEDMYALRKADIDTKKEILDYLEELDKNIGYDIYVCGVYRSSVSRNLCINAYQYLDGVIIPDVFYRSKDNSDKPMLDLSDRGTPVSDIDISNMKDARDLTDDILKLAEQHSSELYYEDYNNKKIVGTYRPIYDAESRTLYYEFRINEYSEVRVDAKTGNIIYEYFWDGTIED